MARQVVQTSRGPVEYRLEGRGPVVMVLNGGHCSRDTRLSHEHLADHGFSVLTPSRPGYDDTPPHMGRTAPEAADTLAALLETLAIPNVAVIGVSAGGPTALAFARQHSGLTRRLILESAVTLPWDAGLKRRARLLFGRAERLTWALVRLGLQVAPRPTLRALVQELTTLPADEVLARMSPSDLAFVRAMLSTSRSGEGFLLDLEHTAERIDDIAAPALVLFSSHDASVPPAHALRAARELPHCELVEVQADSHLIWIGPQSEEVWRRRLAFLVTETETSPHRTGR